MTSISVLIPLYNHARYIGGAIESVLSQTSPADEIVLVDDGSQDDGLAIAESMLAGVENARVFRQPNQGAHETINRLVRTSRADYLAILNSDDCFLPEKLARCREIIAARSDVDLICGRAVIMDQDSKLVKSGETVDWLARSAAFLTESGLPHLSLMNENFVTTTSNMVFSRALWERVDGFQNLRYCHDLDFLMSAFVHGHVELDSDFDHIRYRVHPTNTIKERLELVRLEIASVIAASLSEAGLKILDDRLDARAIELFYRVIDNKAMPKLTILLMTIYAQMRSRAAFYDYLADPERAASLRKRLA
ncbi:glycosyltransferase family 2 protein [Rhizobium sp. No.120]